MFNRFGFGLVYNTSSYMYIAALWNLLVNPCEVIGNLHIPPLVGRTPGKYTCAQLPTVIKIDFPNSFHSAAEIIDNQRQSIHVAGPTLNKFPENWCIVNSQFQEYPPFRIRNTHRLSERYCSSTLQRPKLQDYHTTTSARYMQLPMLINFLKTGYMQGVYLIHYQLMLLGVLHARAIQHTAMVCYIVWLTQFTQSQMGKPVIIGLSDTSLPPQSDDKLHVVVTTGNCMYMQAGAT